MRRKNGAIVVALLAWVLVLLPASVRAQDAQADTDTQPSVVRSASAEATAGRPPASAPTPVVSADPKGRVAVSVVNGGLGRVPEEVRRETPRETLAGFLDAGKLGEFERAAHYLNLSAVSTSAHKTRGKVLARELFVVLANKVWFDMEAVSDEPEGGLAPGTSKEIQVGAVPMGDGRQGIRLGRVRDASGAWVWLFSPTTVRAIDDMHERHGPPAFLQHVPDWLRGRQLWGLEPWQWGGAMLLGLLCWLVGMAVSKVVGGLSRKVAQRAKADRTIEVIGVVERPATIVVAMIVFVFALNELRLPASTDQLVARLAYVVIILAAMRASTGLVTYGAHVIQDHGFKSIEEELKRRAIETRVTTLRRVAQVLVVVVAIALALMQFPNVRAVGLSLLGSAGIAGAVIGFAAQKTFSNIFAGMVISLAQPIRIGDVVVVEKEWGNVEEIGTTHVMVKLWDQRRLILPVSYFLDHPFENWTRTGKEIWGTVLVHADYRVKVDEIRAELDAILAGEELWDGTTKSVIVESMNDRTVVVRILVGAEDSSKLFDLRCKVRERMLLFLQQDSSRLPKVRLDAGATGAV